MVVFLMVRLVTASKLHWRPSLFHFSMIEFQSLPHITWSEFFGPWLPTRHPMPQSIMGALHLFSLDGSIPTLEYWPSTCLLFDWPIQPPNVDAINRCFWCHCHHHHHHPCGPFSSSISTSKEVQFDGVEEAVTVKNLVPPKNPAMLAGLHHCCVALVPSPVPSWWYLGRNEAHTFDEIMERMWAVASTCHGWGSAVRAPHNSTNSIISNRKYRVFLRRHGDGYYVHNRLLWRLFQRTLSIANNRRVILCASFWPLPSIGSWDM